MAPHDTAALLTLGDQAVGVEFGDTVDPVLSGKVLALDAAILAGVKAGTLGPGIVETVPTYRSIAVHVDPFVADIDALATAVLEMARSIEPLVAAARRWRVPVVYGGDYGIDLDATAARLGMSAAELIERHSAPVYRCYMIGFLPGFAYLGGADPRIAIPRRDSPRLKTPAGTISIGGIQAGIQSVEAPSGWHLLGTTPVRNFMHGRDPAFLVCAGDEVEFYPIAASEFEGLSRRAAAGEPVAELIPAER
ncbi:MAG TPA: 5-oxoprolinase subunit PxpB [Hyphomicrobiaceae bacterium]|nr:5-oxoprolinase subunit PxpB [Hyphomicrobiaceae bacterium]